MARVKAKEQDPVIQKSKLERALTSSQGRVEKLQTRLTNAEKDQAEKLASQVKQAQLRVQDAQKHLDAFNNSMSNTLEKDHTPRQQTDHKSELSENSSTKALNPASPEKIDVATAAIERAKAKTEAMASMSPEDELNEQVESLKKRIGKAQRNLQNAESENSEHISVFKAGLEKMQAKLVTTQAELTRLQEENQ
jgi:hypothetical protein